MDKKNDDKRMADKGKAVPHDSKHADHKKGEHRPNRAEVEDAVEVINPDLESMDSRG